MAITRMHHSNKTNPESPMNSVRMAFVNSVQATDGIRGVGVPIS